MYQFRSALMPQQLPAFTVGCVLDHTSDLMPIGHLISLGVFNHEAIHQHTSASPSGDAGIPSEATS